MDGSAICCAGALKAQPGLVCLQELKTKDHKFTERASTDAGTMRSGTDRKAGTALRFFHVSGKIRKPAAA
jgi:exonuclease III